MQPFFPSSRSLAFEDSSEGESTEAFVDAREQSYEGGGAVVKEIVVREEAREIEKVSTVAKPGKVDKRVFKLWELVEGEVAYTEDLVTLVHVRSSSLSLRPSFRTRFLDLQLTFSFFSFLLTDLPPSPLPPSFLHALSSSRHHSKHSRTPHASQTILEGSRQHPSRGGTHV